MTLSNIKNLFAKQVFEFKYRLLILFPAFLVIIIAFILPSIFNLNVDKINNLEEIKQSYLMLYNSLTENELLLLILGDLKLLNYLVLIAAISPIFLTTEIIIAEKEERTLETLFILPITDTEIVIGKIAVSFFSSIILILFLYITTLIFVYLNYSSIILTHLLGIRWLICIFILVPTISCFFNLLAVIVAIFIKKIQSAQYIAYLILIPFMFLFIYLSNGSLVLYPKSLLIFSFCLLIFDVFFFKLIVFLFNRERLLLRY